MFLEAYCHSTKQVLQNTHTHTHIRENQNYVSGSLLLSLNQTQESFHFKSEIAKLCHICCIHLLPTQCTKKKAMHDEHIFLLLSHDLQNLAFVSSHHPNNLIKLTNLSLEEESLYSLKSLRYKFQTGKQQHQKEKNLHLYLYIYIYILESVSSTPNFSRNQQKAALN